MALGKLFGNFEGKSETPECTGTGYKEILLNPPFSKGEAINSSLCKREARRAFQNDKVL